MRSLECPPPYDAFREFDRSGPSSGDVSARAWSAVMETTRNATTSLAAYVRTRVPQTRQVAELLQPRPTRHFLFSGHGQSEAVLSYFDPQTGESEAEKAIVA